MCSVVVFIEDELVNFEIVFVVKVDVEYGEYNFGIVICGYD